MENYISALLLKVGEGIRYDAEGCSVDNDINHLRMYLKNYREKVDQTSNNEVFIKGGTIKRGNSNGVNVLRPTSELCRTATVHEIQALEKKHRKAVYNKQESKATWFKQSAEILRQFHNDVWAEAKIPPPT